jgi:UDP-N-acetylmuramoyl-L-alanyl-D-glutamate--2,6-diaminopimelate ligase
MKLSSLLRNADSQIGSDPDISSIHYRSDRVKPGGLFVAIPGFKADGHDFIDHALEKGAVAVVVQRPVEKDTIVVQVNDTRTALSEISARFYNHPSEVLNIIGITGTNGKTTTAYLVENMLAEAGLRAGLIGTIDYRFAGKRFDNPVTTPESADLQEILSRMKDEAVTHVVMEASSHAIELHRIDHLSLIVGIFTNLSQDHLDFHHDMETYFSCKKKLFTKNLVRGLTDIKRTAVINCNNEKGLELLHSLESMDPGPDILTVGFVDRDEVCQL